jgi:hypothetical protein
MATFVQHEKITYEYIQKKAEGPGTFALLCSTNWCRYCPRAVRLFEKLLNEQKIKGNILKDMEKTLFKQLNVTSYPTFIVYSNGQQIYKGHDAAAFCKSLGIKYKKKIHRRQNGTYYRLGPTGEEETLSTNAAQRLKSYYGEDDGEDDDEDDDKEEVRTDGQGRQFKFVCEGDICRKVYL